MCGIEQERLVIRVPSAGLRHFHILKKNFGAIVDVDGKDLLPEVP